MIYAIRVKLEIHISTLWSRYGKYIWYGINMLWFHLLFMILGFGQISCALGVYITDSYESLLFGEQRRSPRLVSSSIMLYIHEGHSQSSGIKKPIYAIYSLYIVRDRSLHSKLLFQFGDDFCESGKQWTRIETILIDYDEWKRKNTIETSIGLEQINH